MVGLQLLKHTCNRSDEELVATWDKAVTFPTGARLLHKARIALVRLAQRQGVALRQSYERIGRAAFVRSQRYAHARQINRANAQTRKLPPTWVGSSETLNARCSRVDKSHHA